MKTVVVREKGPVLAAGLTGILVFGSFIYCSAVERIREGKLLLLFLCTLVFGACLLFSMYLILAYFRKQLVFEAEACVYIPPIGRRRSFAYSDISKLRVEVCPEAVLYQLFNQEQKKLAVLGKHMSGSEEAVHLLKQRGVRLDTMQSGRASREKGTGIDRTVTKGRRREAEYIRGRWKLSRIERERKNFRLLCKLLAFFAVTAVLLPMKMMLSVYLFILWFIWGAYLVLYPRLTVEPSRVKEISKYYITMPRAVCAASLLILLYTTKTLNASDSIMFFKHTFLYTGILAVPYIFTLYIKKRRERVYKILLAAGGAFLITVSSVNAVNYVATLEEEVHERVTVVGKNTGGGRSYTCYLHVRVDGEKRALAVTNELYRQAEEGSSLRLCRRKSIFGYEYWALHP